MAAVLVEFEVYLLVTCISFVGEYIIDVMLFTCAINFLITVIVIFNLYAAQRFTYYVL